MVNAIQTAAIRVLFGELSAIRSFDFSEAPVTEHTATRGKFKGQAVALVSLSAVDATFPDVVINDRGKYDMEQVGSYPESRMGTSRYDSNLPANALSACIYGDMHLARSGYGARVPKPAVDKAVAQAKALETL